MAIRLELRSRGRPKSSCNAALHGLLDQAPSSRVFAVTSGTAPTKVEGSLSLGDFIEGFYKPRRRYSALDQSSLVIDRRRPTRVGGQQ